jgi:GntR family transcriptional repressor for pyruvate dehydrogenase complex
MALGSLWNRGIYPYIHRHADQAMLKGIGQATLHFNSCPTLMTTPVKPVETRRLYQTIADQINSLIRLGSFQAGMRLPPERELAQQLGVSRPSLREALIALEIRGQVEIRMGSGVYVCEGSTEEPPLTSMGESPTELMQARAAIEGSVIVLACTRLTPEGMARLQKSVESMRELIAEGRSPLEPDRQFHIALAEIAGNSVLTRLVGELFDGRNDPIAAKVSGLAENITTWGVALSEHERILRTLEARDPIAAQAAIRSHLKASEERWVGGV